MRSAYSHFSDAELTILLKNQDKAAFSEIYDRYWALLYIHARKILREDDPAQDLVQELFAVLWNKSAQLELSGSLSSYLYTSVRNRVFDLIAHHKIKANYAASIRALPEISSCQTDELVRMRELKHLIEKEIELLPPRMREIFEMSRKQHLSHKEIASQLGLSDKTVRKQINNAIKILRSKVHVSTSVILFLLFR